MQFEGENMTIKKTTKSVKKRKYTHFKTIYFTAKICRKAIRSQCGSVTELMESTWEGPQ